MPISKGMPMDILTYYSKDSINIGDLVSVNIGHQKDIRALVIDSDTLINRKQDVKSKDWATKKINNIIAPSIIPPYLLHSILKTSIEHELPTGTMLSLLFTKKFWENIEKENVNSLQNKKLIPISNKKELTESTLYIVPTQNEVKYKQKELKEKNNTNTKNIIVSTPCLDHLINNNITEIILSDYESPYYIHPHYKINMGELLSGILPTLIKKEKYIYNMDRVEILRDEYQYVTPLISAVTDKLINNLYHNLKENKKGKILIYANRKGESPLSRCYDCGLDMLCPNCHLPLVLHRSRLTNKQNLKNINDNGIENKDTEIKYYLCHHCGYREDIEMPNIKAKNEIDEARVHMSALTCNHCGGWRIMPIGISTGSVESHLIEKYKFIEKYVENERSSSLSDDDLNNTFDKTPNKNNHMFIYRIDHEVTNTDKKVKDILKAWDKTGGILITNDKGLFHPEMSNKNNSEVKDLDIAYSIVISLDGMYSIPDPMIEKRIIHILNRLNAITRKQVIVHTHLYENTIFKLIEDKENLQSNIEKYDEELEKKIAFISPPLEGGDVGGGNTHSQSSPNS